MWLTWHASGGARAVAARPACLGLPAAGNAKERGHQATCTAAQLGVVACRQQAAGDQLRVVYSQLSQDPNSLANLDQDLPNYAQHSVPIFSLPQVRQLRCQTGCHVPWAVQGQARPGPQQSRADTCTQASACQGGAGGATTVVPAGVAVV